MGRGWRLTPPRACALLLASAALTPSVPVRAQALPSPQPISALSLPASPPPPALPQLQEAISCPELQQRLQRVVGPEANVWSVTVADGHGRLLADINGRRPRIPASNQKLISTAIALDRLGPQATLITRLWRQADGSLRLTGEGDPDLDLAQVRRFAELAMASGPTPRIVLVEEPQQRWWPAGWHWADRAEVYGAPITRLALTSNALDMAVSNPPGRFSRLLSQEIRRRGGSAVISIVPAAEAADNGELVHQERSIPMQGLLSLANNDSHNFTAEVLLRQGTGSWDLSQARQRALVWLVSQGLPMEGVAVADGSGLDRGNRVTSRFLTALLLRMAHHPEAEAYLASMAVSGQRGTLRNLYRGTELEGQFRGKTGTISGVRAISGVLSTADGPRYISMVSNGSAAPNGTIGALLRQSRIPGLCPGL